jgi:hypothetical protein
MSRLGPINRVTVIPLWPTHPPVNRLYPPIAIDHGYKLTIVSTCPVWHFSFRNVTPVTQQQSDQYILPRIGYILTYILTMVLNLLLYPLSFLALWLINVRKLWQQQSDCNTRVAIVPEWASQWHLKNTNITVSSWKGVTLTNHHQYS